MSSRFLLVISFALFTLSANAQDNVASFEGRWTLHLPGGAGWLEVTHDQGNVDASLLWYGGSVLPVASANITGDQLTVTRTQTVKRDLADGSQRNLIFTNTLTLRPEGDRLVGKAKFPNHSGIGSRIIEFEAERIPELPPAPDLSQATYGDPIEAVQWYGSHWVEPDQ